MISSLKKLEPIQSTHDFNMESLVHLFRVSGSVSGLNNIKNSRVSTVRSRKHENATGSNNFLSKLFETLYLQQKWMGIDSIQTKIGTNSLLWQDYAYPKIVLPCNECKKKKILPFPIECKTKREKNYRAEMLSLLPMTTFRWRLEPDFLSLPRLTGFFFTGVLPAILSLTKDVLSLAGGGRFATPAGGTICSNRSLWYACMSN